MQCKEWDDANSELFKESHDEAVHKNSYKSRLYELISASLTHGPRVVAADAAGTEALVGVLKIIKDASYNKTIKPPWRAMEKRPPLVAAPPPFPLKGAQ